MSVERGEPERAGRRPGRGVRITFRLKLMVVILAVSGVVAGIGSLVFMSLMRSSTRSVIAVAMGTAGAMVAMRVDPEDLSRAAVGDVGARAQLEATLGELRGRFGREVRPLIRSAESPERAVESWYIATVDRDRSECVVVARVGRIGPGARFAIPQANGLDVGSGIVVEGEITDKPQGRVISGFAPVRDGRGDVVGLVGLDAASSFFEFPYATVAAFGAQVFAASLLIGLPAAWLLANRLSRPVAALHGGMGRLAQGELDVELPARRRGDEFDALVREFNGMAAGLREREEMRRSLRAASEVQKHLLPQRSCAIPGYEVCVAVRYCDATGGDYADCFPLDDDATDDRSRSRLWGLAVGDVTGHGIGSALLMAWARAMLRGTAPIYADDPALLMRLVNRHLMRDTDSGTFLTLFFGVLDAQSHTLAWVSAGHEPAVVVRGDRAGDGGGVEKLGATDVPLGIERGAAMPVGTAVRLEGGDVLVVGTDGVTQARSPDGEFFGVERLAAVVRERRGAGVTEIRDALFAAVRTHRAGLEQDDDETFVIVRRAGGVQSPNRDRPES